MNNISKEDWYSTIESMLDTYSTDTVRLYMTKTWKQVVDLPKNEYSMARKKYLSKYKRVKLNITKETVKELIEGVSLDDTDFDHRYFVLNLMFINPDLESTRLYVKHTYPKIIERVLALMDNDIDVTRFMHRCNNMKKQTYLFTVKPYIDKVYSKQYCYDILKQFDFKLQDTKYFYIKYILPN